MEYIYGQNTLKTVGDSHSDLSGFCSIMREYPDQNITDNFTVVKKIKSDEDAEGKCYDWYEITEHYRYVDRVKTVEPYTATQTAYYGESEKVFYNVPQGNISVFFNNYNGNYKINRISDRVLVTFDTLKDYTNIKIMVQ